MNLFKAMLLATVLFCLVATPASAGYYIAGASNYGFGFTGFGYAPPAPTPAPPATGGTSTLGTSSCLLNSCAPTTPGATTTTTTTTTSTSTVATSAFGGSTYSYSGLGLFGTYTRYSVFGMYNIQGTGGTQTPTLSGGLTPTNVLGDPLANPEPTSIVLFGAGLVALGWMRKRRTSRSL